MVMNVEEVVVLMNLEEMVVLMNVEEVVVVSKSLERWTDSWVKRVRQPNL